MGNRDWLFIEKNKIHSFRSAGVLINEGKILIQRSIDDSAFALPGGHVAWGETSAEALIREYKEELGVDITVDRLIWVEEVFWKWGERDTHTICHYHLIRLNNRNQIPNEGIFKSLETDESRLIFKWVNINELQYHSVYPTFLKEKVNDLSGGIEHFIGRD